MNYRTMVVPQFFLEKTIKPACKDDSDIMYAFRTVPREFFVDEAMRSKAYSDNALPIGFGQTISQPSLVAMMLKELNLTKTCKCLEVGSGSGFATALLGKIVDEVYSCEIIPEIFERGRSKVREFMMFNVKMFLTDGAWGLPDKAPFDRILVSAGANTLPQPLVEQLAEGGIMIIPINDILTKVSKINGKVETKQLAKVAFVDFVGT